MRKNNTMLFRRAVSESKALGENGKKAAMFLYDGTADPAAFFSDFARAYYAGANGGNPVSSSVMADAELRGAMSAGNLDATGMTLQQQQNEMRDGRSLLPGMSTMGRTLPNVGINAAMRQGRGSVGISPLPGTANLTLTPSQAGGIVEADGSLLHNGQASPEILKSPGEVMNPMAQDGEFSGNGSADGAAAGDIRNANDGAGEIPKFKSWDDFSGYIQDVGKDTSLTIAERVQKIQKAYNGIADKTDINIPVSDKYVKGFTSEGKIEYDWPGHLGFDTEKPIEPISRDNMMPEIWDRYGSMKGSNFADIPASGRYSNSERSIPYVENEKAYHSGKFNNATYFDKIDAIKSGNLEALNEILKSEGIPTISETYFNDLKMKYDAFIAKIAEEVGTYVDATYGIKGKVAAWRDLKGGAGQITTPFIGDKLLRLGIIV